MIRLRCSALPEAFRCAESVRGEGMEITSWNPEGPLGTAAHEALARVVDLGLGFDGVGVDEIAQAHGVKRDDLGPLVAYGIRAWAELKPSFPEASSEFYMEHRDELRGFTLTGHADAVSIQGTRANLLDWKTGRVDRNYSAQIRGYLVLLLLTHPMLTEATGIVVWLRNQEVERYTVTRAELNAWLDTVKQEVVERKGRFVTGGHCAYCPRSHECKALAESARRDVAIFAGPDLAEKIRDGLRDIEPAQLIDLVARAKAIARFAENFVEAVKVKVNVEGEIVAPGAKLAFVEEPRRELDPLKAWPILQRVLEDEQLAECIDISITSVEKAVAKAAGKGKGAAAKRDLEATLIEAGALTRKTVRKLKEIRT